MKLYKISEDGLKYANEAETGTLAFIFDGCIVSGWPLQDKEHPLVDADLWEGNSDVSFGKFSGVEKYIVFDKPIWEL